MAIQVDGQGFIANYDRHMRRRAIRELRDAGWTWKHLGMAFGVTRQRAWEIAATELIRPPEGGEAAQDGSGAAISASE